MSPTIPAKVEPQANGGTSGTSKGPHAQRLQTIRLTSVATPEYTRTPIAQSSVGGLRRRSDSQETLNTSITGLIVGSAASIASYKYPDPPVNSPTTQSVAGDSITLYQLATASVSAESLAQKLNSSFSSEITPPTSVTDADESEGKTSVRDFATWHHPPRKQRYILHQTLTGQVERVTRMPPKRGYAPQSSSKKPTKGEDSPPETGKLFPEHSNWEAVAEEDLEKALKRLAMLAKDEHKVDPSKPVEAYYSKRLANIVRQADLEFDIKALSQE